MRLDKYLKVSRLIKRRTVAADAAKASRILVNGHEAKPAKDIKVGDVIEIIFGLSTLKVKVLSVPEVISKQDTSSLYEVVQ